MAMHPASNRSESMNRAFAAIAPSLQMCCCCLQSVPPQTGPRQVVTKKTRLGM